MYRLKQDFVVGWRSPVFGIDGMAGFRVFRRRFSPAASLIEKETDERRTSNIERPTSNNEFCPSRASGSHGRVERSIKKKLSNTRRKRLRCTSESALRNFPVRLL
jgi:hypothetical protein